MVDDNLVAAILSFIFPGLGQIVTKRFKVGFAIAIAFIVSTLLTVVLIGFLLAPIVWIYGIYDGYNNTPV